MNLYWAAASTIEEGRYLEAVLNSDVLTKRVRPLQARGEHNPRHYDKYIWQLPVPMYEPQDPHHARLGEPCRAGATNLLSGGAAAR